VYFTTTNTKGSDHCDKAGLKLGMCMMSYLKTIVKYIEYNPIKAGITHKIGAYKWAMSSKNVEF